MKPSNNDRSIIVAKKIEIIKEELNPILKNNTRKKFCLNVTSLSNLGKIPNLKQLDDRLLVNFSVEDVLAAEASLAENIKPLEDRLSIKFSVEDPLDNILVDGVSSIDDLEKFRMDFRVILDRSTKVRFIETKKKKPILLIFSPFSNLGLEDKCMVLASENKDLDDFIDIVVLVGYSRLEITS
jgi:hypothetical protein